MSPGSSGPPSAATAALEEKLDHALQRLERARPFAKGGLQGPVLDLARRLLLQPGGLEALSVRAPRLDGAGIFAGTDWDHPAALSPALVANTLQRGEPATVVLECMSQLRMLAVAEGRHTRPGLSDEQAQHFLTQVLALNLSRLFGPPDETARVRLGPLSDAIDALFRELVSRIGFGDILGSLITEIWRILAQRPIQVGHVKAMVTQIALALAEGVGDLGETRLNADRLVSALFSPTRTCHDDPGMAVYRARLDAMDAQSLEREALGMARAMHDVGLVSDYHAELLRWLVEGGHEGVVGDALGLGSTGLDALSGHRELVHRLVLDAVVPATAQTVYGLARLLERGVLHAAPIAPSLWRQIGLVPSPRTEATFAAVFGTQHPARVHLLAGVIAMLGQPLGVGQGNNPTCQAARALSMWAYNDPDYLLHLIAQAALFDGIVMHFEGRPIATAELAAQPTHPTALDTDPVSIVLVPHLDLVYNEMGRMCADRGEDPHRWINPELHGWWVGREFAIAVDVATGALKSDYDAFLRHFYASYHPDHNGNQPIIHPQPAGLAVTDASATFVGWHAITLLRVAPDPSGTMRMYFYNPNNDSGQNWGHGVVVSTQAHGERFGEASLPFPELASRLYIFHDDPVVQPQDAQVPAAEIEAVRRMAIESWAATRVPQAG